MATQTKFNGPINPKQRDIIQMAKQQLHMDDANYRKIMMDEFGKSSCTKLSFEQANQMIDILIEKGFVLKPKKKGWQSIGNKTQRRTTKKGKKVVSLASPAEHDKIAAVAALIEWKVENGQPLFLEKRCKIKKGKVRTAYEAWLAIEALKKMFENGMKAKHGAEWWIMEFEDPRIMDYISYHKPQDFL